MLIALLADIHANREALTACLADAESAKVDRYVFLGDLVGYGADPTGSSIASPAWSTPARWWFAEITMLP